MPISTGVAAGVPYLAVPPIHDTDDPAPVVVAWHLMDPPRTEAAFAAALPLDGLDAWRIYLGLPMCGARMPAGGPDELMRLGFEDAVLNLQGPVATQGAEEFPAAFAALREQLGLADDAALALVGGSMGSAVALLVLSESAPAARLQISAAVLVSPMVSLRPAVDALGRRYGVEYPWGPDSLEVARRLDFVSRADELAGAGQPAVQLIVGAEDDVAGFQEPARQLRDALAQRYADPSRAGLVVVSGMAHPLAEEPGAEPAPQTPHAEAVDQHAVGWLSAHLHAPASRPTG
jgi:hypothetical protein